MPTTGFSTPSSHWTTGTSRPLAGSTRPTSLKGRVQHGQHRKKHHVEEGGYDEFNDQGIKVEDPMNNQPGEQAQESSEDVIEVLNVL